MRQTLTLTKLFPLAAISLAVSFVSWVVGGEFLRILVASILPLLEPVGTYLAYVLTGLLLGAINGLVLYRFVRAWFILVVGVVAGWGFAFLLTTIANPVYPPMLIGWLMGLAAFTAMVSGVVKLLAGKVVQAPVVPSPQIKEQAVQQPQQAQTPTEAIKTTPQAATVATIKEGITAPPPSPTTTPTPTPTVAEPQSPLPPPTTAPPTPTPTATPPTTTIPPIPPAITPPLPLEPSQTIEEIEEALIEMIGEEGMTEIVPLPNNTSPEGGSYPEIESRLKVETTTILRVIKRLMDKNYIRVSGVEFKKVACPHCQSALNILTLSCRSCGSTNIGRQRILQHEICGYLGPEDGFTVGGRTLCPRCGGNVKILRGPLEEEHEQVLRVHSSFFICYNCNEVSPDPHISFRCLTCGLDYDLSSFEFKTFYRYAVNPEMIVGLQEQKKPLRLIAEELRRQGYEVQLGARLTGSSKVRHKVDLLYSRGGVTRGAVFFVSDKGGPKIHEIMKIIVMKADTKIDNVKLLCLGQVDNDSKRLSELYNIAIIENIAAKDLATEVIPRLV